MEKHDRMAKEQNRMSETDNKYKAVITPKGIDEWTVTIYECAEPPFRVTEETVEKYTEEMIRLKAKSMIKEFVSKREAIKARTEIIITEDDLNG